MLNLLRIRFASEYRVKRSVHYKNPELLTNTKNQDGIVFAAHYSCWEYMGLSQYYLPQHQTIAAYQPSHGALDRIITEGRARFGAIMAPLSSVFRTIFERRNMGRHTYSLMVSDQSPAAVACDFFLTFLQQQTPVFTAPERIAQKIGAVVLYLRVREIHRFQYEYEFVLLSQNAAKEEPHSVIGNFFAELEKDIKLCPHLWMWSHRIWKHAK
jgi:KDO2-lipid IV(A) lauroyltransferase